MSAEYELPGATGATGPAGPAGPSGGTSANYWFHDDPSDIATYSELLQSPANGTENNDTVSVVLADGEKLIEAYATAPGDPGLTSIPAGDWTFFLYRYASVGGVGQIVVRVYKRDLASVETLLFFVASGVINESVVTPQVINYASPAITLLATDRIVVKIFGKTSVPFATIVHFVHDGVLHASYFQRPAPPPPSVVAHLADTTTHTVTDVNFPPGVTQGTSGLDFWHGGQTNADVPLGADAFVDVLSKTITGLAASSRYSVTLDARVRVWTTATPSQNGSLSCVVDLDITTDGASVATVTPTQPPSIDPSRLATAIQDTDMTITAIAGGFKIQAKRQFGVAMSARARWVIDEYEKIA
jgi:hypothetical protein